MAGGDFRANTHDQVEDVWRVDWEDRGLRPPRISVRRLAATITAGRLTLDVGKQFIRWARADVLNPIDRFAPRDYTNVIDTEFLPVIGGRATLQLGPETIEVVWLSQLTPSRMPLLTQRWSIVPAEAAGVSIIDLGSDFTNRVPSRGSVETYRQPLRDRTVVRRWIQPPPGDRGAPTRRHRHRGALSCARIRASARTERSSPSRLAGSRSKAEGAYFVSPEHTFDEYGLYVAEIERQVGEWLADRGICRGNRDGRGHTAGVRS